MAPPNSQNARSEYHGVSQRHQPLAVVSRDYQKTGPAHNKQTDQNEVLDQHFQITNRATRTTNLARHTMEPSHEPLADPPPKKKKKKKKKKLCPQDHNQTPPRSRTHNKATAGGTRWTNQLCLPSPLPFKNPLQPLTRGSLVHATTKGMWSPTDKEVHINTLEVRAVRLAIQFFQLSRCHLVVYTDNETVRYTLKQLRTKSTTLRRTKITRKLHGGQENNHAPSVHSDRTECSRRWVEFASNQPTESGHYPRMPSKQS